MSILATECCKTLPDVTCLVLPELISRQLERLRLFQLVAIEWTTPSFVLGACDLCMKKRGIGSQLFSSTRSDGQPTCFVYGPG